GRLALLLGEQLNAQFTATGPMRELQGQLQATSPRMTANLQLAGDGQALRAPGSQVRLQLTPDAWAAWLAAEPGEALPATLLEPVTLNVDVVELLLPRVAEENGGVDL